MTTKQAIKSRTIPPPQHKQPPPQPPANPNSGVHPALSAPVVMYLRLHTAYKLLDGIDRISTLRQNTATSRTVRVHIHIHEHFSHLPSACCCI